MYILKLGESPCCVKNWYIRSYREGLENQSQKSNSKNRKIQKQHTFFYFWNPMKSHIITVKQLKKNKNIIHTTIKKKIIIL